MTTTRTIYLSLLTVFALAPAATAQKMNPDRIGPVVETDTVEKNVERIIKWIEQDDDTRFQSLGAHTDAGMAALDIHWRQVFSEYLDGTPDKNLAGTYTLSLGLGVPDATLQITRNADGTYAVARTHEGHTLTGSGKLAKTKTLTNTTVLTVTFRNKKGATDKLAKLADEAESSDGQPNAIYSFDPKIGHVSGTFYTNEDPEEEEGDYEAGWREGATPISYGRRMARGLRVIVGKINARTVGFIRTPTAVARRKVLFRKELWKRVRAMQSSKADVYAGLRVITKEIQSNYKAVSSLAMGRLPY